MGLYCTANAEVYANVGFENQFGSSSEGTPSLTQVNYFINQTENEINLALYNIGITTVSNAFLLGTLTKYNAIGAAGMVLRRYGNADDKNRGELFLQDYKDWLKMLIEDITYQAMISKVQNTASMGILTGSAVTNGYVPVTSGAPIYGVDSFNS